MHALLKPTMAPLVLRRSNGLAVQNMHFGEPIAVSGDDHYSIFHLASCSRIFICLSISYVVRDFQMDLSEMASPAEGRKRDVGDSSNPTTHLCLIFRGTDPVRGAKGEPDSREKHDRKTWCEQGEQASRGAWIDDCPTYIWSVRVSKVWVIHLFGLS